MPALHRAQASHNSSGSRGVLDFRASVFCMFKFKSMDSLRPTLCLAIADIIATNDTNHHEPHRLPASLTMRPPPPGGVRSQARVSSEPRAHPAWCYAHATVLIATPAYTLVIYL